MAIQPFAMQGQTANYMLPSEALSNAYNLKKSQMQSDAMAGEMRDNALMDQAYRAAGGDLRKMDRSGLGFSGGMKIAGMEADMATAAAQADKAKAQADKDRISAGIEKLNFVSQALQGSSAETWNQDRQEIFDATGTDLGEQYDPAKIQSYIAKGITLKDQLANQWKQLGYELDVDRFGEQRRHNQTAEGISYMNAQNRGEGGDGGKPQNKIWDATRGVFVDPNTGTFSAPTGMDGGQLPTKVSATDKKLVQSIAQSAKDAEDSNALILQAEALLPKATGSMLGKARDVTMGAAGYSTDASEAATQLKIIGGGLVSKVPKMSGPQSDADVRLYREMAGQVADESQPVGNRMAALKTLKEINQRQIDYKKTAFELRPELQDSGLGGGNEPQKPSYWDRMSPEHQKAWLEDQN